MEKQSKEKKIFMLLVDELKNSRLNDYNLDTILKRKKIREEDFYYYFPYKTISLFNYFLRNIQINIEKKVIIKFKSEKSISKRVNFILIELIKLFEKDKDISLYFLNFIASKPILLKKTALKFADWVWCLLKDKSVDFNFYTKRIILSQIVINSVLYWRGTNSFEKTTIFINRQINSLGKFGFYKSKIKKLLSSNIPKDIFSKFDFLH